MQAIVQSRYGSPDILELRDVPRPAVADDQVLIRVRAASINALDWRRVRASPFVVRLVEGVRRPRQPGLGVDAAGIVESVGSRVTDHRPGDEVFGIATAAFAEYAVGRTFVQRPTRLSFEQAAAIPVAGTTALQALRDKGRLRAGERVLVVGAGGGVGTFAVQIARAIGAHVTATTAAGKLDMLRSIGADEVIDYDRSDVTRGSARFDLVLDVGGRAPLGAYRRVLTPGGRYVLVGAGHGGGGPLAKLAAVVVRQRLLRQPYIPFMSRVSPEALVALKELVDAGAVTPVIDRTYPLPRVPEALRYLETEQASGKVVITVS